MIFKRLYYYIKLRKWKYDYIQGYDGGLFIISRRNKKSGIIEILDIIRMGEFK